MLEESPGRAAQAILLAAGEGVVEAQACSGRFAGRPGIAQDQCWRCAGSAIAAGQGHLMARNMLGRCNEHGWGCEADAAVAVQHYRIAAEAGLTGRCTTSPTCSLPSRHRREPGASTDPDQCAAKLGHAKSMNLLGPLPGRRTPLSAGFTAARDWYRRAAEGGDFRGSSVTPRSSPTMARSMMPLSGCAKRWRGQCKLPASRRRVADECTALTHSRNGRRL